MTAAILTLLVGLALSFANGANDTFKGVATLYGARVSSYRTALAWAVVATFAGALLSILAARALQAKFSGYGLVDPATLGRPRFPAVLAASAGLTVLLATRLGMPISTTHALVGALSGTALLASPSLGTLAPLGAAFFLPLVLGPLVSLSLSWAAQRAVRTREPRCLCVADRATGPTTPTVPALVAGTEAQCAAVGARQVLTESGFLRAVHFLSAGAVSFARGLNDTPKLVGVVAAGGFVSGSASAAIAIGLAMSLGGIVGSRRIAQRMSRDLTPMSETQGTASNVLTAALVGAASVFSLPVSTTHVSCGTIFGLGAARGELSRRWTAAIAASWLFTLPAAGLLAVLLWPALAFLG
ncbi:MAG TPA: inorganic phosphate transporter [Planctomycetota bacterium]|nr:inorganic phosphate transporter [Planctomycetota bacterium]